ncbi:hypothetical protein EDM22_01330 [Agromyces tardus]|uniref:Uncharacterized protein n=1 Tax=Agromyces tardus TaxID=2583849 RepID=A0A3M8APC9_9MICO|nr:hypothetical protein [Agromyces tardus]RNB52375.1 hypothetical protein EDM22_01330 [Agromyces tardus]
MTKTALDYSQMIREALADPSPRDSVDRVKTAVAKELEALDASAQVKSTNYFNHTFAPDFVLRWRDNTERSVFIRITDEPEWLAEDISYVTAHAPLVLDLSQRPKDTDLGVLRDAAAEHQAMVSGPEALERLIDRKPDDSTATMVSNALAQGGRGLFVQDEAVEFAQAVASGFDAAAQAETARTASAVEEITENLGEVQASRMTRVLQAVWEGSDGRLEDFPGTRDLSGRLNLDSLRYLLNYMDSGDRTFWQRIGRGVRLRDLTELGIELPNPNVSRLIQANLDVLQARACAVFGNPMAIDGADAVELTWSIRDRFLTLEGPSYFVLTSESKEEIEPKIRPGQPVPSIDDFIERADPDALDEVTLRTGTELVIVHNEEGPINGDRLTEVAGQRATTTGVEKAKVKSPTGRVTVDFRTATGTRQTRSNLLMADLLQATIPLVLTLEDDDRESLAEFLAYEGVSEDVTAVALDMDGLSEDDGEAADEAFVDDQVPVGESVDPEVMGDEGATLTMEEILDAIARFDNEGPSQD